jgi:hypothetical protein
MARLQTVVDECLAVATAFVDISSSTYNELSAVNWDDNDKYFPMFLFDKRSVEIAVNKFSRLNLPSRSTYTQTFYFFDTYLESEKSGTSLQAKQDALMVIADQYFAELRGRNASGENGFYLGDISFNSLDDMQNNRLIQLAYNVELIVHREDCSLGSFSYAGVEQPTNLICSSNTDTSIDISWTDNATGETNYEVWRSSNGVDFTLLNTIAANSTTYSDTGLPNETPYAYKVRAITTLNNGKFSNIILCTTDSAAGACADATVENSTQSYQVNVASGGTLVLPDITHIDPQGNNVVTPAQVVFDSTTYASGIVYKRPTITGSKTSFYNYDDVWNLQNGVYDITYPTYPASYAQLDLASANPFITLLANNAFGTKDRFTDINGLQVYGDDYIIDHLTGLGWYNVMINNETWEDALDNANASTQNGYSNWRVPNNEEWRSVMMEDFPSGTSAMNYAPFNQSAQNRKWTSTTNSGNSINAYIWQAYTFASRGKTNVEDYLIVRNHYN